MAIPFSIDFLEESPQILTKILLQFLGNAMEAKTEGEEMSKELVMIKSVAEQKYLTMGKQPKGM
jgi:hypothetical protein